MQILVAGFVDFGEVLRFCLLSNMLFANIHEILFWCQVSHPSVEWWLRNTGIIKH